MRKTIYFLVSIIILVTFSIFPCTVSAQTADALTVIDDADIFGNNIDEVEAAASELENMGADIRIRTISTYGNAGNLDLYEEQLELESPSWLGQGGERKNNLIVIIITMEERETGLYYGSYWGDILEDEWLNVTGTMNSFFSDGNFADGVIAGLEHIQQLIEKGNQTTTTRAASGSSNGWVVPLVILIILFSITGLFIFSIYRQNRARQQAVRQKAILAKQGAASGINELIEKLQMLEIKVDVIAGKVTQEEAVHLREGLEKVKIEVDHSSVTYSELSHSAGDPENPRLGEAQLQVIEPEYRKILDSLQKAREAINAVEAQISGIQEEIEALPRKVNEVNTSIEQVLAKQEELKQAGYKTDYITELIAGSRATLEHAQDMSAKKQFGEATKCASEADEQVKNIIKAIEELPRKKQQAETAIPVLAARIEQVKDTIDKGREIFDRIFLEYAESTWEPVQGNGTEAENRIDWAAEAYDEAVLTAKPEQQDWLKAMDMVEKGNNWLTEAESFVKSISELEINLKAAQRDAPTEIEAAQADIKKAWDYIYKYDEDIRESLEDDLRVAEKNNDLAREELKLEKPDFFKACKLAREANESADKILEQARNEYEAAERLRAKTVSAKRDATAKVSIAKEYIQDHNTEVKTEARKYLTEAEDTLHLADTSADTITQLAMALKAEEAADKAYTLAKRDFNNTNITIAPIFFPFPLPGGSSSSSTWGTRHSDSGTSTPRQSGGGSSGWGRSSGGGSTSWGGGRSGGGSSSWGSRGGGFGGGGGGRSGGGSRGW